MNECCEQPKNLEEKDSGRPDLILRVCAVCGNRHFELQVDPGSLGLRGAAL